MFGLPSWAIQGIIGLVALLGAGTAGGWLVHSIDQGTIQHMRADLATAQAAAQKQARVIEQKQSDLNQAQGAAEAAHQAALDAQGKVILKEVVTHVHDPSPTVHVPCVTWGIVRVLDAAARGVSAAELVPPGGQSDDACSTVEPSALAAGVVANYNAANQNAEQLNSLEAAIREKVTAFNAGGPIALAPPLTMPGGTDDLPGI